MRISRGRIIVNVDYSELQYTDYFSLINYSNDIVEARGHYVFTSVSIAEQRDV